MDEIGGGSSVGDELRCPRCGVTKSRKPDLRLLVNVCGHSLCETCIDLVFARGTAQCPTCGTALRRHNFKLQYFEDATVQREVDIRRQILRDYNKREADFSTLADYNDYLEMVETIVYNLSNNVDVAETRERVRLYQAENRESIKRNVGKQSADQEYLEGELVREAGEEVARRQVLVEQHREEVRSKVRQQSQLIDTLLSSELPAQEVVERHRERQLALLHDQRLLAATTGPRSKAAATTFSSGIKIGADTGAATPATTTTTAMPYKYVECVVNTAIPRIPGPDFTGDAGHMDEWVSEVESWLEEVCLAGGFPPEYVVHKSLCWYYDSLSHDPSSAVGAQQPQPVRPVRIPDSNMFAGGLQHAMCLRAEEDNKYSSTTHQHILNAYTSNIKNM